MKIIRRSLPQGDAGSVARGCAKKLGLLVVGIVVALALLGPSRAAADQSTPITQLQFLKIMVQVSGDTPKFNANSTAADYVLWARGRGVNVTLQPNAPLSRALLSQALVQFLGINPNKLGGDYARILAREGITVLSTGGTPTDPTVTRADLVTLIDGPFFQPRISPIHGNNGVGNGIDPQPPGNPPVNDGIGTSPGHPGLAHHHNPRIGGGAH